MAIAALVLLAAALVWTQIDRFATLWSSGDSVGAILAGETLARGVPTQPAVTQTRAPDTTPALTPPSLEYVTQVRWSSTWVNVREGRGGSSPVVQTLQPGQRLQVDKLENGWWAVYLDGRFVGYVADNLLLERSPNP
jgi:uncharacterized protein YgiM (DUF1202 family)